MAKDSALFANPIKLPKKSELITRELRNRIVRGTSRPVTATEPFSD